MLYNSNLINHVFSTPYQNGYTSIKISSGYASPEFLLFILNKFPEISIDLTIGMISSDKIFEKDHSRFVDLVSFYPQLTINYVVSKQPNHSKIYHWYHSDHNETTTFIGSANFSANGFLLNKETMLERTNIKEEIFSKDILTIPCTHELASTFVKKNSTFQSPSSYSSSSEEIVAIYLETEFSNIHYPENARHILEDYYSFLRANRIRSTSSNESSTLSKGGFSVMNHFPSNSESTPLQDESINSDIGCQLTLSLLTNSNEVGNKSGLNWGHRGTRNRNESYLRVPSQIHLEFPNFFPQREQPFIIQTDDGEQLTCVMAQNNQKAIQTTENNALLGTYFRKRIGVPEEAFITLEDLQNYGKTYVTIKKLDNLLYYMEF